MTLTRANFVPPVQLLDEGAVQMLRERSDDGNGNPILAAVGTLQFDGGWAGRFTRIARVVRRTAVVLSIEIYVSALLVSGSGFFSLTPISFLFTS